jgi:hypothetical protein
MDSLKWLLLKVYVRDIFLETTIEKLLEKGSRGGKYSGGASAQ